eukprot:8669355-Pyramimonas_sp.AAC.1
MARNVVHARHFPFPAGNGTILASRGPLGELFEALVGLLRGLWGHLETILSVLERSFGEFGASWAVQG